MSITDHRFRYRGEDNTALAGFRWSGGAKPKAVVQLAHGAGEHSQRYLGPLAPIIESGYVVYAADHRGHGLTSGMSHLGDFGPGGVEAVVSDMAVLTRRIREEQPGLPVILLGHSMGAMLSQVYVLDHSDLIDALILSGTSGQGEPGAGPPNMALPDARTPYDWLSRDPAEVDKYIADPFCGIRFTPESGMGFLKLRERRADAAALAKVRKGLPTYIFVGDADPVNDNLKRLTPLVDAYKAAGLDVEVKVYPGGRHEMLNETNRDEVVADLKAWLDKTVAKLTS